MSTSNFLHRNQSLSVASTFAGRLQRLTEKSNRLAIAQNTLQSEYSSLLDELSSAAQSNPELLLQLQGELNAHQQHQQLMAPPPPPPLAPALDLDGGFLAGVLDEDLSTQSMGFTDVSPPFGPTDVADSAIPPFSLAALDEIPPLSQMTGPAIAVPDTFTIDPSALDLAPSHVPSSNSSGESFAGSPFSASPPTSYSCSPIFSPMDAHLTKSASWNSSTSVPFHSFASAGSSFSSHDSAWPSQPSSFCPAPSTLFPDAVAPQEESQSTFLTSLEAQLDVILAGSVAASLPVPPPVDYVPLARVPSQAGRARPHRQASLETASVRFSPMAPPPVEYGGHYRQPSATPSVSSLLASPEIKPFALARQGSNGKRTRTTRVFKEDPSLVVEKNMEHIFAVHVSSKNKLEANESPVIRLILDESTLDPASPLGRTLLFGEAYSPASFRLDCTFSSRYTFYTASRAAYIVTFSLSGPTVAPASASDGAAPSRSTKYTFLHFLPADIVTTPSEPLGSIPWWRLQECRGSHAGYPGSGAWTARYDGVGGDEADAEKRRPARIYSHFAKCCGKGCEEQGEWSLMKLAKAMKGGK
ncbi:hypothetical protein JCM6882_005517 [Rhodosporidiobolus microsporus]